jgi:hypothetical protein
MMTTRPKFLVIKNFREFQHYHTRGAPWIKLYARLLDDDAFLSLAEAAQAQLMKLWLLASQVGHPLPNKPKLLAGKIAAAGRFHLQAIIAAGFLIESDEPASNSASTLASKSASTIASSDASATHARVPERREVRGERTENYTSSSAGANEASADSWQPAREAALADRLEGDADRIALATLLARAPSKAACAALIAMMLDGGEGQPVPTSREMGRAIQDFNANSAAWNASYFRAYVRRAIAAERAPPTESRASPNGKNEFDAAIDAAADREKRKQIPA